MYPAPRLLVNDRSLNVKWQADLFNKGINNSWSYIAVWQSPEGKCDQSTRGSSAREGALVTFSRGFSSDSNIWPGMINPDYDISVYNNIFNYLSWIILILPQITGFSTSRWEDKVTATNQRVFNTHEDPSERMFKSGLIKLMPIVFCLFYSERLWHSCLQ